VSATKKPPPRPRKPARLPGTGTPGDVPHVGRAMPGCGCLQCAAHRQLARQDAHDQRAAAQPSAYEGPMLGALLAGDADAVDRAGSERPVDRGDDTRGPFDRR